MEDKLKEIFASIFDLEESEIMDDLSPQTNEAWESITHLMIITEIESVFDIAINEEIIPDLNSFKKIKDELLSMNVK